MLKGDNSATAELLSNTYQNTVGDKRYELSNHLGNVLSVVTDRKLLNMERGIPIINTNFNDGTTYPFIVTPQANSITVESGRLVVDTNKARQGVETTIHLEAGRKYLIQFFIDKNAIESSVEVGLFDSDNYNYDIPVDPYAGIILSDAKPGIYYINLSAELTQDYKLLFKAMNDVEQGNFILDNINLIDITDVEYKAIAEDSPEIPIFVPDVLSYNDYYPFGMLIPPLPHDCIVWYYNKVVL